MNILKTTNTFLILFAITFSIDQKPRVIVLFLAINFCINSHKQNCIPTGVYGVFDVIIKKQPHTGVLKNNT